MDQTLGGFNPIFVFIAYGMVWLILLGYVFYLAKRQGEVRAEIAELRAEMERHHKESTQPTNKGKRQQQ